MPNTNFYPHQTKGKLAAAEATESLIRMIKLNETTLAVGKDLCENLHRQGEQIHNVTDELNRIDDNVEAADMTVGNIRSTLGLGIGHKIHRFFHHMRRSKDVVDSEKVPKPKRFMERFRRKKNKVNKKQDPFDKALGIINGQVAELKDMSKVIASELLAQNSSIIIAGEAVDITADNVDEVTHEADAAT